MSDRRCLYRCQLMAALLAGAVIACSGESPTGNEDPPGEPDPQVTPARLEGRVDDGFGTPVSGARVELTSGPQQGQVTTGPDGSYAFPAVSPGTYALDVIKAGFKNVRVSITMADGETKQQDFSLEPGTQAIAVVAATRIISLDPTSGMVFEVDVAVMDQDGKPVAGLDASSFDMGQWVPWPSRASMTITKQSATAVAGTPASYSAMLLMDQSGSIISTDPANSRLMAGKVFMKALGSGDEVQLAAFSSGGLLPAEPVTVYGGGFSANGQSFFGILDHLAQLEGGSTPLFRATHSMISYVASNASRPNKALVVFTDGDDTEGGPTILNIADACAAHGVRLYMVALGNAVTADTLGWMVGRCGGTVMHATDAPQLVSLFGTLGGILAGSAAVYRTRWHVNGGGCFCNFIYVDAPITVTAPNLPPLTTRVWLNIPWPFPGNTPPTPAAITVRNDFPSGVTIDPGGSLNAGQLVMLPAVASQTVSVWDCGEPGGCKWDPYTLSPGRIYRVMTDPAGPFTNVTIAEVTP